MTHEHVELVLRQYEAWNRGDVSGLIALTHPDFQWVEPPEVVGTSHGVGPEAYERHLGSFFEVWQEFRWEPEDFLREGETLIVRVREIGRGKISGARVEQRFLHMWTMRGGQAVRMERCLDEREPLRLTPSTPPSSPGPARASLAAKSG